MRTEETAPKDTGIIATKNAKIAKMGRLKCFFQTPVETYYRVMSTEETAAKG
jgi:hypothetical protein